MRLELRRCRSCCQAVTIPAPRPPPPVAATEQNGRAARSHTGRVPDTAGILSPIADSGSDGDAKSGAVMPMHVCDCRAGLDRVARIARPESCAAQARYWIAWAAIGGPMAERDFLDKMVTKRTARNPAFPQCWTRRDAGGSCCARSRSVASSRIRRRLRSPRPWPRRSLSSRVWRARRPTRRSRKSSDMPGSLGCVVQYHLVPLDHSADEPTVVVHESSSVSNGV
jgi:hypothetical protein